MHRPVARSGTKRRQNTAIHLTPIWCGDFPEFRSGGGCWLNPGMVSSDLDPSPSQLGGLGERCKLPPAGSGAEPQPPTSLENCRLKRKHLVLYKSLYSKNSLIFLKYKMSDNCQRNYIYYFLVTSGTQPCSPSYSVNSQISYLPPITARGSVGTL